MTYTLPRGAGWFEPVPEYDGGEWKPTRPWGLPAPEATAQAIDTAFTAALHGGETGDQPPPPCQHERTVEQLRSWLSRQPFDGRVVVGDVLLRLGKRPV